MYYVSPGKKKKIVDDDMMPRRQPQLVNALKLVRNKTRKLLAWQHIFIPAFVVGCHIFICTYNITCHQHLYYTRAISKLL